MKGILVLIVLISCSILYPQNLTLRDTTNQYDYIIITLPEYKNVCEPFRQHKETVRDLKTLIVDTVQILNEFNSSQSLQDNIRDFLSYAGTFWTIPLPRFILITGTITKIPNFPVPLQPSPQNITWSDYLYAQNIYENDSLTTDFYVGRIPAKSPQELENYFNKIIEYESGSDILPWMNSTLFLCQDDLLFEFWEDAHQVADSLPVYINPSFYIDTPDSANYGNKDSIINFINNRGAAFVFFEGRGTDTSFIAPEYFNLQDVYSLNNSSKYFLGCWAHRNSPITDANTSIAREMLLLPEAGSIGGTVTLGPSLVGTIMMFQEIWCKQVFNPGFESLGEALVLDGAELDTFSWYMRKITNLWGDPSLKIRYDIISGVEEHSDLVNSKDYSLIGNYPNPFNPSTRIKYSLNTRANVRLTVYNTLGETVNELVNSTQSAGEYAIQFNAFGLASGIYFYRLQIIPESGAGREFVETKKMLLIK